MTRKEVMDLVFSAVKTESREGLESHSFLDLDDVTKIIDKIFESAPIKDSFNNNHNCTIKIG